MTFRWDWRYSNVGALIANKTPSLSPGLCVSLPTATRFRSCPATTRPPGRNRVAVRNPCQDTQGSAPGGRATLGCGRIAIGEERHLPLIHPSCVRVFVRNQIPSRKPVSGRFESHTKPRSFPGMPGNRFRLLYILTGRTITAPGLAGAHAQAACFGSQRHMPSLSRCSVPS